jgi:CheY-like chemotaxis protein
MATGPSNGDLKKEWRPPSWSEGTTRASSGSPNSTAVLVVDDDEALRTSVASVLRTAGFTTLEAADGDEAYRFLSTMRFQLLLLDLKMPRCDGLMLLSRLKNPPPVVIVSGNVLDEDEAQKLGPVVTQLRKPVNPLLLLDTVSTVIRGHSLQ